MGSDVLTDDVKNFSLAYLDSPQAAPQSTWSANSQGIMMSLIMSGAAILQALLRIWPTDRLSVADRGLREGLLYAQMSSDGVLEDGPF